MSPGTAAASLRIPEEITAKLESVVGRVDGGAFTPETSKQLASLYGLLLGSAYSLCQSFRRLEVESTTFLKGEDYIRNVRLRLHKHLPDVAATGETEPFDTELVGFHLNVAQHFLHILFDRLLNILFEQTFQGEGDRVSMVFYAVIEHRVTILKWRLGAALPLGRLMASIDEAFSRWRTSFSAPGSCDSLVRGLLGNGEVNSELDRLLEAVKVTVGHHAGSAYGSIAYVVDRTNEAKHLPDGTGRCQLAHDQADGDGVRRLYRAEWALTLVAFESILQFLSTCIDYLIGAGSEAVGA